jgi:hypothetical protein
MNYKDEDIADMSRAEIDASLADADSLGIAIEPKVADQPSAEPISDLTAQLADMSSGNRQGVYLSSDNIANVDGNPAFVDAIAKAVQGAEIIENADGNGGVLIAKDKATADAVRLALDAGADPQRVLGVVTGAGTGKAPGADTVVQQRTPEGAVTRETVVPAAEAPAAAEALAADGRTVETMPAEDAISRREQKIAKEQAEVVAPAPVGDGSRKAPVKVEIPEDIDVAAQRVAEPTEAQKTAGNYSKGHVKLHGLDITIENPKGSIRSGKSADGAEWQVTMPAAYGYFKKTLGKDGDHLDVYIGDDPASDRVWVVDQVDAGTGRFDEHKALLGFPDRETAVATYEAGFSDGRGKQRIGAVTEMPVPQFRAWARDGKKTKPLGDLARQPAAPKRKSAPQSPATALAFIRNAGGIRPDSDLRQIADGARIPGLFNRSGVSPDDMLRLLEGENYIQDRSGPNQTIDTSLQDLYDLVSRIVAGERIGKYGETVERPKSKKEIADQSRREIISEVEQLTHDLGVSYDLTDAEENRLVELVETEYMDVGDALERIAIEAYENEREGTVDREEDASGRDDGERPVAQEEAPEPGEDAGRSRPEEVKAGTEEVAQAPETGPSDSDDTIVTARELPPNVPTFADAKLAAMPGGDPLKIIREYAEGKGWRLPWTRLTDEQKIAIVADLKARYDDEAETAKPLKDDGKQPAVVTTEPTGQTSLVPEATTSEKLKAAEKANENKGKAPSLAGPKDRGPDRLRDYSGIIIDGYANQKIGNEEHDGSLKRGFLSDARDYLTKISKVLKERGFEPYPDTRGKKPKPGRAVNVNPAGPAVSGDVSLSMIDKDGNGIYVNIGDALSGPKGGISLMARKSTRENQYSGGQNQWWPTDLTVAELADRLEKLARPVAPKAESGQTSLVPEATTSEKIAAETKAKEQKVKSASDEAGPLFNPDAGKQTDLVDMAKSAGPAEASATPEAKSDAEAKETVAIADESVANAPPDREAKPAKKPAADEASPKAQTEAKSEGSKDALVSRLMGEGFKTIVEARKFVKEAGILPAEATNKQVDEAVETAVVRAARQIVESGKSPGSVFKALVDLYGRQPNLASRTGTSVANQAYSTPAPLAYVASRLAGVTEADSVFEPTAGNGMLLIEAKPRSQNVVANEIDQSRQLALSSLGFNTKGLDGSVPGIVRDKSADTVIMNPPFGAVKEGGKSKLFTLGDLTTTKIDHAVSLNALDAMADDGKAVLIIGGPKGEDAKERMQSYRGLNMRDAKTGKTKDNFYRVLYDRYNVTDHFTVSGDLYTKQGASWPVDVIVIEGRGKSERPLPGTNLGVPALLKTWDEIAEKIPDDTADGRKGDRPARRPVEPVERPAPVDEIRGDAVVGTGADERAPEAGAEPDGVRPDTAGGQSSGGRSDADGQGDVPAAGRGDGRGVDRDRAPKRERVKIADGATQARYEPVSGAKSVDTLVPAAMADSSRNAMERVAMRRGEVDEFVRSELGYEADAEGMYFIDAKGEKQRPFSAEQIDAIAAAIDNIERGGALIVGDQTGIGKGRVGAGLLRYAMKKGLVPVLVTEKMDLYGDMYRDMRDIGIPEMLGRDVTMLTTDVGKTIPMDEAAVEWKAEADAADAAGEKRPARRGKFLSGGTSDKKDKDYDKLLSGEPVADVVFTTYSQMQSIGDKIPRRRSVLKSIAPRAIMVFDEVHNAAGQGVVDDKRAEKAAEGGRAQFVRELTQMAKGVVFMSATYAKRPNVMDLYARTDMGKAVEDIKDLPALITKGGVPMQQIVASMLAESGQYLRRERSFEGIEYAVEPATVDENAYNEFVGAVQSIFKFDIAVKDARNDIVEEILAEIGAGSKSNDSGIGEGSASSTSFSSIMHNIVSQMLLAIKADVAADRAIAALKANEKPVITLANTNESFYRDAGFTVGDVIDIDFGAMLKRYLSRTLRITYKRPGSDKSEHYQIPVERLPASLQQAYQTVESQIEQGNYEAMPVSPIDWIRSRITKAGYTVSEITGRQTMIDYGAKRPKLVLRPKAEAGSGGKRVTISKFNGGTLDAVILNRSGSTGVSMHAKSDFKDKRKRRMILAQAEGNIDTHMQMLGRVHRTGQVVLPAYTQLAAGIPAEVRPTAVLMKKMASLNANTTGARGSAFTAESADFMNEVGDKVMAEYLWENPEINVALGEPYDGVNHEDLVKNATGKLVLLEIDQQREMLDTVQQNYAREIAELDALGENPLEAKMLDLQAETLESVELKPKTGDSPFLDAVRMEKASVKAQGRALPISEIADKVAESLKTTKPEGSDQSVLDQLERKGRDWLASESRRIQDLARRQLNDELAQTKAESQQSVRAKAQATLARWQQTMSVAYPGARVSLTMPSGTLDGIVMSTERSGKAKSITALSAWMVKIAVPDSARQFEFPMSKLFPPGVVKGDEEKGAQIARSSTFPDMLIRAFEDARKEGRETRYIVTGNILGGYDQTKGKGRIVNFTTNTGEVRPGVLMERGFELDKFMNTRAIRFQTGEQVAQFLDKVSDVDVNGRDGELVLGKNRVGYYIQMAKAKFKAGKYYTDKAVRFAIAPTEFESRGNTMLAEGLDRAKFAAAVDEMKKIGAAFETDTAQDQAQAIIGGPKIDAALTAEKVIPFLKMGRTVTVPSDVRSNVHAALAEVSHMVPKTADVAVLKSVSRGAKREDGTATVSLVVETADGSEVRMSLTEKQFLEVRAFVAPGRYLPGGRDVLVFPRLSFSDESVKSLHGELWHEVVHHLRSSGRLTDDVWGRLLAHAKSLRVLDSELSTYLRAIGDPNWKSANEGAVREAYEQLYHDRADFAEIMDQEAVTHFVELASHGELLPMEIDPVRDVLMDIWNGVYSRKGAVKTEGQPMFSAMPKLTLSPDQQAAARARIASTMGLRPKAPQNAIHAPIPVTEALSSWLGIDRGKIVVDLDHITRKRAAKDNIDGGAHPDLATPEKVKAFIEDVIANGSYAIKYDVGEQWNLLRQMPNGEVRTVGMRLDKNVRGDYEVKTAFVARKDAIPTRLEKALRHGGGIAALKWKKDPAAFGHVLAAVRQLAQRVRDPSINLVSKQLTKIQEDMRQNSAARGQFALPGGLTPAAEAKRGTLERQMADAVALITRMTGPDAVRVSFSDNLSDAGMREDQRSALAGVPAEIAGKYTPPTLSARAVIELSLGVQGRDLVSTAGHEAYHHVETVLASPQEMKLLQSPADMARARRMAMTVPGMTEELAGRLPDWEIRAIAFQRFLAMQGEGVEAGPIHIGIRRLWNKLARIVRSTQNLLRGHGFDSIESIFERARTGEMRAAAAKRGIGQAAEGQATLADGRGDRQDSMASFFPSATSPGTFLGRRVAATMRRMAPISDQWRVRIQDRFLMMRRQQEAIERQTGVALPLPLDVYTAESLFHGRAGERMADLQSKHIEPLVEHLRKNEIDGDQLGEYLYARHAGERNAYIRTIDPGNDAGSGMTDADAQAIMDRVSSGPKAKAFADAAAMVDRINKDSRDTLLASGLISREVYDAWSSDYQNYVPLRGFEAEGDESAFPRVGKGYNIRGPEAYRALGRRSKSDNPLAYVLLQAQQAIVRSEKNRVNKALLRLVETHPDPDVWQVYRGEYSRRLNETTGLVETVFVPPQFSHHDPSIVGVKVGGKQRYIQLHNPNLARALKGVGSSEMNGIIVRSMMKLTRFYAQLLTSWNPEFVVGNFFRDVQTALINSKDIQDLPDGARKKMLAEALSLKSIRGIYNALRGDGSSEFAQYFEEFRQAGGKVSFMEFNDVERIKGQINGLLTEGKTRRALRQAVRYVEDVNTSVENGVRLSTYVAMRKAGISKDRAASVARELTVNFNRKGELGPVINSAYMFFNASVQGSIRMFQAFARSKAVRRVVYTLAAGGVAMEMLNYLIAGDDDDGENAYDKIKPWIKERNMIFMLPGRKDYFMIPMPYGYNAPYVAGQKVGELLRTAAGHGKATPAKAAAGIMSALMDSINPLGTSPTTSFLQMVSPTMLDPIVQVAENKTWYGGPITPIKYDKRKPDSESYFASVHPAFITTARLLNSASGGNPARSGLIDISPEVLEHYAQFIGGGSGKFLLNVTSTAARALDGEEFVPEKTPIIRRLYGKQTQTSRRGEFYEKWGEVDAAAYEVQQLTKAGNGADAMRARREYRAELEAYGAMKGAQKSLSQFSKIRAQVQLDRSLPNKEKKAKLDEVQEKENAVILRAMEVYSKAQKKKS